MSDDLIRIGAGPQLPQQPTPARSKRKPWWLLAGVAVVVLLGGGAFAYAALRADKPAKVDEPKTIRIVGQVTLNRGEFTWDANPDRCGGYKGYDDLHAGAPVIITDASGTVIAKGELGVGEPQREPTDNTKALYCHLPFVVDVPTGEKFYGLEISHRGRTQYTPAELNEKLVFGF